MIEGLVRHDTEMRVEKNFVDSHGQSEVAFAFWVYEKYLSESAKHRPKSNSIIGLLRPLHNLIGSASGKTLIHCRRGNGAKRNVQDRNINRLARFNRG